MEMPPDPFKGGVLSHLEELETLARNLAFKQEKKKREQCELEEKRKLVLELKKQRDELLAKVKLQNSEIQALNRQEETKKADGNASEIAQEAALDMRLEELKGMLEMHWVTGISGKRTKRGVCVCISTAFEGAYLDSYHLNIVMKPRTRIANHSVPPFIPLEHIAQLHLESDLRKFLSVLFDHLNAYSGRKYQFERLQALPQTFIADAHQRNSLYTVLTFGYNVKLEDQMFHLNAKLLYGDSTLTLPTVATITCEDSPPSIQEKITPHSNLFCQNPLHKALEVICSEEETLNHTSVSLLGTDMF